MKRPTLHQKLDDIERVLCAIVEHLVRSSRSEKHLLRYLLNQGHAIMATLDEDLAVVTANSDRLDSLQTYIEGLNQRLMDALSGANLPPDVQAKVDAIFAGETANTAKIDKALNTGVPAPTP
jgi:hypothetical protein